MLKEILSKKKYNNFKQFCNSIINVLERKVGRSNLISHPIFLDITPTLLCNIDCIFCIEYKVESKNQLSLDDFKRMAEKAFPYSSQVNFCSGGEPFLNKNMMDFLAICKQYRINSTIVTNGMLLTKDICESIVRDSSVTTINFSFDGAKKKTVESIRLGIDYDKVRNNIQMIAELKKKYGKIFPTLGVRCAVMSRNIEEIPELIKLCKEWGVNKLSINYLNVNEKMEKSESLFYKQDLTNKIFDECISISESTGVHLDLPPRFEKGLPESFCNQCSFPWKFMKIDPDGSVRFCYLAWKNPIGNIFDDGEFTDIWNNEHYRLIRKTVNTDKPYFMYCGICAERKGANHSESHIKEAGEELNYYNFDKDYEKTNGVSIPQPLKSIAKSLRGLKKNKSAK